MVSVIIPVYNEINYLEECVNSIVKQTYANIEIILVDDGSTNSAGQLCDRIAEKDGRIKVIHQQNQGLSAARMNGYDASSGEWVMFVDDDDRVSTDMVRILLSYVDDEIDIIAGWMNEDASLIKEKFDENPQYFVLPGSDCCDRLADKKISWTPLWGKLYRREFLDKLDLRMFQERYPTIFFEDMMMNPVLSFYARKVCIVQEYFYYYRVLESSLCHARLLGPYYYEQIGGGNDICEFLKEKKVDNYYSYRVSIYVKDLLRVYCLMDYDNKTDAREKALYKAQLLIMYHKWKKEYWKYGTDGYGMKILVRLFPYCKEGWKKLANKFYFSKNNKNIMGLNC